jgi:hypothetical protein
MDSLQPVRDEVAWRLAAAYIDAWNKRDRDAWLDLLHPDLVFRPTALVGTGIVYHGIDGAARYFNELIAGERPERAQIFGLRRLTADRFVIELELLIDDGSVAKACVISQVRDDKFVDTAGYLSDARSLASAGHMPEDAPAIPQPVPEFSA